MTIATGNGRTYLQLVVTMLFWGGTWVAAAVQRIGASRASIFINLVPVAAVLQGALLLGERLDASVLAGGALVIVGVILTQRSTMKQLKEASA